ncbi:UxaA family hydrolase [Lacrimispora indolis]|uniref:UxaA family hydrolase n=1 Tax=Lacrimispora indolis TaxID=69825 RepID=UPI00045E8D88|nr:UxaA family hydrolase [Lacrimispora indolis]
MSEVTTNAMIIDEKDTVAVAIEPVEVGSTLAWLDKNGELHKLTALTPIPIYHKFAIKDMEKGEPVVKYGEHIGLSGTDIHAGQHVHVHNVENHREQL